ncbi:hypothetical protein FIE12Z_6843 [Fusarium flagelliforme]|uniref:Xylanolytic transcriptional activator regulatory domain-containing protein n=2 Tax=Fusarium flagelliforme TaxID=2675880 RepID=A0A395MLU4_9HYPO|nr:hypothetical protein FIE12Z_6843 [Fusarium flagelliforme]
MTIPSPSDSITKELLAQNSEWDEERRERNLLPPEADDVNALSLPLDKQASYLGISSVKAALGAMLQMRPQLRALLACHHTNSNIPVKCSEALPSRQSTRSITENTCIRGNGKDQALVNAYFERIHIFTPMLDETSFRTHHLNSRRDDAPWLSLLNMVLAMGSIVANKSSDRDHCEYYTEAMKYLDLNAFGSSHIETLQALALLGGYYLHYINQPNKGNAIIGAALRMASALGFHREPLEQQVDGTLFKAAEIRRRTWWSLVCLETWTTTTLGHPSFGRFCPSIDVQPPKLGVDYVSGGRSSNPYAFDYLLISPTSHEERNSRQHMGTIILVENIQFCRIATEIQDMLVVTPFLSREDRNRFDNMLINWYDQLPSLSSSDQNCAEPVNLARCVMRWRYWNLRMLLYRPALLDATTSCVSLPELAPPHDYNAIEKCQQLSKTVIEDIAQSWVGHQMSGWNAVWFLYQAAMIPLLSMLWQPQNPSVVEWKDQVQMALKLFQEMQDWSLTARRSHGVVSQIYQASCELIRRGGESQPDSVINSNASADQDFYSWADGLEVDDVLDMLCQDWSWDGNCTWNDDEFVNTYHDF